jgi:hypothetical protein
MSNFNPNNTMPIEEGQALYENRAQQALAVLAHKGFGGAKPPMMNTQGGNMPYQGHVPTNLPEMTDNELGYYMGLLSEWNNYVQQQLAESSVNFTKAKAILEHVEANLRIAYQIDENDKKRSNPERDDYMTSDRRYAEAKSNLLYWDTLYTSIKAIANSAEQAFAAVSRRITQRGQEIDRTNRVGGTTGQANIPAGPMFGGRHRG